MFHRPSCLYYGNLSWYVDKKKVDTQTTLWSPMFVNFMTGFCVGFLLQLLEVYLIHTCFTMLDSSNFFQSHYTSTNSTIHLYCDTHICTFCLQKEDISFFVVCINWQKKLMENLVCWNDTAVKGQYIWVYSLSLFLLVVFFTQVGYHLVSCAFQVQFRVKL